MQNVSTMYYMEVRSLNFLYLF